MKNEIKFFFNKLEKLLIEAAPIANELDANSAVLKWIYSKLINIGALRLLIPTSLSGYGGTRLEQAQFNIEIAQHSGALLFLQAQHQFAITQLHTFLPNEKIENLFSAISQRNISIGIFLKAQRKLLNVYKTQNGFEITGTLPWVTGWNFLSQVLIAFEYDEIRHYALIPFQDVVQNNHSITISAPIKTAVFYATNTVSVTFNNWFIANEDILHTTQSPREPFQHPTIYNFAGAAKAALSIAETGLYFNSDQSKIRHEHLTQQWKNYYDAIIHNELNPLQLRAQGLMLAEKCILFSRVMCGAVSLLDSHPLNRINREVWQYTIAGYSNEQAMAYLAEI